MGAVEVFKFGGASVKDPQAIRNVGDILKMFSQRPLVVVISAMGKMTNHLEQIVNAHYNTPDKLPTLVNQLKSFHEEIANGLLGEHAQALLNDLHDLWVELGWILEEDPHPNYHYHYDQVIVFGELASTRIVSAYLANQNITHEWMDARSLIKTDAAYREARVLWDLTKNAVDTLLRPSLQQHGMVVTQGFIGSTVYNESTSLGREGSDYTASILANLLDATSVTIWKDVPGIMTGDPRVFPQAEKMDAISYTEAIEMTYYGAKVIHPKTIKPLQNKNIPLFVRPFDTPSATGTKISAKEERDLPAILVMEPGQALLQFTPHDYSFVAGEHLSEIFQAVAALRIKVNSMRNTALSFILCVTNEKDKLIKLQEQLSANYQITLEEGLQLLTVRHAKANDMDFFRKGRKIILEERFGDTDQIVVRDER